MFLHLSVGFPAVLVFDLSVLEQPYLGRGAEVGDESGARGRPYGLRNANLTYAIDKYTKKTIQTTSTTNTTPRGHTRWNGFSRGAAGLPTPVGATLGSGGCRSAPRLAGRSVDCR
jgi:hypothetical protein